MKLVDRYIIKNVFSSMFLVILMLTGLQAFILMVNQLGDLGKADYGMLQALWYVMLGLPYQVYLFFPMASLLGCLIGLGVMANHSELVIFRAAGMSILQVTLAVLKMAILLIVFTTLIGETLLPKLVLWSEDYKKLALHPDQVLKTKKGLWLRVGYDMLTVETVHSATDLEQIEQFHFDQQQKLIFVRHIQHLQLKDGKWWAFGVNQTNLSWIKTTTFQAEAMPWPVQLDPRLLEVSQKEPQEMSLAELEQFIAVQKLTHQNVNHYQLNFWQRIVLPFTIIVMMLLAIPFVFGPLRSSTMGSKLVTGAVIGFGFYICNRICGSLSQIYQWHAFIAAMGPTVFCAMMGLYLMKRAR